MQANLVHDVVGLMRSPRQAHLYMYSHVYTHVCYDNNDHYATAVNVSQFYGTSKVNNPKRREKKEACSICT